jgi:pimeloyl-ACP methyl ester carboxylesterase
MQARLLLVHSPLVSCGTWEPVASNLAGDEYAVTVPDLAGAIAAGPPFNPRQARVIAGSAAGQPVILIGHSRAGPLLATAGTMLGEAVRGYVFVDAQPPAPRWPDAPGGYLQLSDAYAGEAARARELGWPVRQMLSHHLALLTEPGRVAREVRELIGRL